jgi:predicted Zn-dependent protease
MKSHAVAAAFALASLVGWSSCALNRATGERELSLISESQEIQMGRQAAEQVDQTLGFVDDRQLQGYVQRIGRRLAAASERPRLPWQFHVVDDPTPNAFALPGGFIYVTRGMLNLLTSEAELASVLGHEVAHVTARHAVSQISTQQLTQLGLGLGSIFFPTAEAISPLLGAGLDLLFLKYSRDDEREADAIGFRYVNQQGYAVSEFADVFSALQRAEDPDGGLPGWFSTHPAPPERVEAARARAAEQPGAGRRVGREVYLRQIDGLVYGDNPRHGFFRDSTFYHPELRFQLRFPRDWQTDNFARAVVGVAPDRSSALELTLVPADTAEQALRRFAAQPGLDVGSPDVSTFTGITGLSAPFVARTAQGALRGMAAFARHRGRVYRLLGYTDAQRFGAVAPVLNEAIDSFAPVTDPAVLRVEPSRIDIIQVARTQTLGDFARRYSSAVPVARLAVINHLPSASARIEAGTLVKRVVSS